MLSLMYDPLNSNDTQRGTEIRAQRVAWTDHVEGMKLNLPGRRVYFIVLIEAKIAP